MSSLSIICAGAIRPEIAVMEKEIYEVSCEIARSCHRYETTISKLNSILSTGTSWKHTPVQLMKMQRELHQNQIFLAQEKSTREITIEIIRANIINLKGFTAQTLNQIENFTHPVIQIMESYLEEI